MNNSQLFHRFLMESEVNVSGCRDEPDVLEFIKQSIKMVILCTQHYVEGG